jgi:hypothetical protein
MKKKGIKIEVRRTHFTYCIVHQAYLFVWTGLEKEAQRKMRKLNMN